MDNDQVARLDAKIDSLDGKMERRFDELSVAMAGLAKAVGEGFTRVEGRLDGVEDRLSRVEVRVIDGFENVDKRLTKIERRSPKR